MATMRARNAKEPFEIHHDEIEGDDFMEQELEATEEEESRDYMDDDDIQGEEDSEGSDDSDGIVDTSVQEDMDKFQETFKGITDRFRLINRIGEGWFTYRSS